MKTISLLSYSLFLLITTACAKVSSGNVDASTINGAIQVNRTNSVLTVSDTFYVGGSTGTVVTIDSPAQVLINGLPVSATNNLFNDTTYAANLSFSVPSIDVNYIDKNGVSYDNPIATPGDLWLGSVPASISLSAGFSFSVNTHSIFAGNETIEMTLYSQIRGSAFSTSAAVANASTQSVFFSADRFRDLTVGAATLTVCRNIPAQAEHPYPQGTSITVTSCTPNVSVTLIP